MYPTSRCSLALVARHPVANIAEFIPNDVELGGDRGHVMVLTGPNMGGKSTLLRQARSRRFKSDNNPGNALTKRLA